VISFRYHLVSVIGIFLAVALGVVVGTTALNGAVVGDLRRQVSDLKKSNTDAAELTKTLQQQAGNADALAQTFGAKIAAGKLANTSVVLLSAPGAPTALKDAIAAQIAAAGGKVSGRVQLSKDFLDPKRATDIRSLATSGAHPIGLQLPTTDDAGRLAGSLLGFVLLGKGQATDLTQVLAGFSTLNMAKVEGGDVAAGKAIVFIVPGALAKDAPAGALLLSMSAELGGVGATVVAGDSASATSGGLIAAIRGDDGAKKAVSTVDDATGALGQLTVALTTADAVAGRKGQYGTSAGADALVPDTGQ
jgi:hypothetical protein